MRTVTKQRCPDCGRDFVNLANHNICHGRGTRHRQTSDPPQSASRSPAQPRTNVDYRQRNANPTPNQPLYTRYGTTNYWDTPPPTPSSPQRERQTPSSVTLLYPSIQTVPQGRGNTHHQPPTTQPQSRQQPQPQPQLPSRQRSHQQRNHHDLESLLYGRISDASQRQQDESDTNAASTGSPRNIVREHRIVVFTDSEDRHEEGVDTGRPRREYLRLLLQSIVSDSKMLHGDENQGFLIRPHIFSYLKNHFRVMGVMLATIIAQGGQSPAIFAPPVVDAILDIDQSLSVDYVPNRRKRESLTKVSEARDATELEEALQECNWRDDLDGIPSYVTMANRDEFLYGCVHHFVILQSKPMIDQLIQGLRHCGLSTLHVFSRP
ncbi:chromodomain-helicase-DNA-binding protein 7-like [Haliotis rufescens]|uniref:chromodomain-helicase-DNA-binding protein 7-like n=1 Tax=Haliotis rufescens TaxID=6454 RepID=UPI00201F11D2|nr:chromodomain-helicase-DNA-binding protein 7-like [Haliotis rufescens]